MSDPLKAAGIARMLAGRIRELATALLPARHREGRHEWRCGSLAGEDGSLGVHLSGPKAGVWCDFTTDHKGDALDLVRAVLGLSKSQGMAWARRWLRIEEGAARVPPPPANSTPTKPKPANPDCRWRKPWDAARPISKTLAELYLAHRGLAFKDPGGDILRFTGKHFRRRPDGELEHHPAVLALLRDIRTGVPCGIVNIYLRPDGSDRIRDAKGKTVWGQAAGAAVMLDEFEEVTSGLTIGEGPETGIALWMSELRPVWCCGGAGNLLTFPVLGGIEALTVAADADEPGQKAADAVALRWRETEREVVIIAPPRGDWADGRR